MSSVIVLHGHPLVRTNLSVLRDKQTPSAVFRQVLDDLSYFLAVRAYEFLETDSKVVETPLEETEGFVVRGEVILVPILRAGLGLVKGFREMYPSARVGHLGMYRDEKTLQPVDYYSSMPDETEGATVFVLDPMLATGGSAVGAIDFISSLKPAKIVMVCLVAAPEGVEKLRAAHPDLPIVTASLDRQLNEIGYILPGLGDAGDRIFGT